MKRIAATTIERQDRGELGAGDVDALTVAPNAFHVKRIAATTIERQDRGELGVGAVDVLTVAPNAFHVKRFTATTIETRPRRTRGRGRGRRRPNRCTKRRGELVAVDRDPLRGVLVRQNVATRTNFEFFFVVSPNEWALVPGQTPKIHSICGNFTDRPLVSKAQLRRDP